MNSNGSTAPDPKRKAVAKRSPNSQRSVERSKTASKPSANSNSGKSSKLEDELASQLKMAGIKFIRELAPIPGRRFRYDFAMHNLLVEVQGGIWGHMGHSTGTGITRDCEKLNLAVIEGWRVLHVTAEQIKNGQALHWIQRCLTAS